MKIDYPAPLAAMALEDLVLLVWAEAWLQDMVVKGVAWLAQQEPERPPGVAPARPTAVIVCASLAELATVTAPAGRYDSQKARCVIVGDGDREADQQGQLLARRAVEGWRVLVAGHRPDLEARLAGRANARVWPAPDIVELAFQISQLRG